MIYKILGSIIIVAALAVAYLTLQDSPLQIGKLKHLPTEMCKQLTPAEQLSQMIDRDFDELLKTKALPVQWNDIATIEYKMDSTLASALLGKRRPHLKRIQNGKSFLEVEVMDLPDPENPGIILQVSLFDIKSKNKIFEIGRTYTMNELNQVPREVKSPRPQGPQKPANAPASAAPSQGSQVQPVQAPPQNQNVRHGSVRRTVSG